MFTGIIQALTPILSVNPRGECLVARIKKPAKWKLVLGQSITVDGICSTVTKLGATFFEVEYMPETLRKTTAATFQKNTQVNLERSLTLRDYVDGHLVSGHVDARGKVAKIQDLGTTKEITFVVPKAFAKYIVDKGSIAINGISLTVVEAKGTMVSVALIPYTLLHTNMGLLKRGDSVNIEIDIVARYVEKMLRGNK
ncbi:MAG: riboflavin synthase [Candidatus Moraniibacteriota bacterium]